MNKYTIDLTFTLLVIYLYSFVLLKSLDDCDFNNFNNISFPLIILLPSIICSIIIIFIQNI